MDDGAQKPRRHALLTGASSGIGEALARALARDGYAVTACARREELLQTLVEEIRAQGGTARSAPLDVTHAEDVRKVVEESEREFGPVDLVIANAGLGIVAPVPKLRLEWVDQMVDVNLKGAMYTILAVLPGMLERGKGHVVGISSLAGYRAMPGSAIYSATKAGLSTFLEGLRAESRLRGVLVTDICPGFIQTKLTEKNRHPMPLLMSADAAAERILAAVRAGRARLGFPWPMHMLMRLVCALPDPLFDVLARMTARKMQPKRKDQSRA